jgi:hypothetical protein
VPGAYLGPVTAGESVEGLDAAFTEVGAALVALEATVAAHVPCFTEAIQLLGSAQVNIRLPAVADFQAQLTAATSIAAQLTVTNPIQYLQSLLAALASLAAQIPALIPTVALSTQISAAGSIALQFADKIAAVDLQLSVLTNISNILASCAAAIAAALAATSVALARYTSMQSTLGTAGFHALTYSGQLSGLGAGIDAVTPSTGLAAATNVLVTIQLVQSAATAAAAARAAIFKTAA